jgi:pimeloyl-ACP methyl ester carboxylesterase
MALWGKRRLAGVLMAGLMMAGGAADARVRASDAQLRARYRTPHSRFMEIDSEPIRYAVQGRGPAIVLMHGSFASLNQWDGWAKRLSRRFTVIRFDMPPAGLSGPHPKGDISLARKMDLIAKVTHRLGADRFILVATSSAGVPAAAFTADHPEQVRGLILNNIAVGPVRLDPSLFSPTLKQALAEDAKHPGYHEPDYWRQILLLNIADPAKVTPALVREWTDFNNRMPDLKGLAMLTAARQELARTPDDLPRITTPTLLLWSADDHEARLDREGKKALKLLASPDKSMVVIPQCGHMMPLDCSGTALDLALPFIDRIDRTIP